MPRGVRGSLTDRSAKSRLQIELHPKNREHLEWLIENTDAASYSEVCRRALYLLFKATAAEGEGKEFGYFDPAVQGFERLIVL